jgi:hypothetical protein
MMDRECSCFPDERPHPCQKGYALSVCLQRENEKLRAALRRAAAHATPMMRGYIHSILRGDANDVSS